jgi:hypothetical protein
MARKQSETSDKERQRRLRQAAQQSVENRNLQLAEQKAKYGSKGAQNFGLVQRHQKKTGRGT